MSEEKQRKAKLKELLKSLNSSDEKEIVKGLKALKVYGDGSATDSILDLLLKHSDNEVELETLALLSSLKSTEMPQLIVEKLKEEKYLPIRQKILSTVWQSGLNYSPYLKEIVSIAVEGDFMEKVECITIVENLDGPFVEADIMESMILMNNYFERSEKDPENEQQLMKEMLILIKDFQE